MRSLRFITPDEPSYTSELDLRFRVLREPLGLTREDVLFPFERDSLHLVAEDEERVVGCVMFHPEDARSGRLLQMAVSERVRGTGLGRALVLRLESELYGRGFRHVHLHARATVAPFYERLGYARQGESFQEIGIEHVAMCKALRERDHA